MVLIRLPRWFNIEIWLPDISVITVGKCYISINLRTIKHNTLNCSITLSYIEYFMSQFCAILP
jgi:hypothetical protein